MSLRVSSGFGEPEREKPELARNPIIPPLARKSLGQFTLCSRSDSSIGGHSSLIAVTGSANFMSPWPGCNRSCFSRGDSNFNPAPAVMGVALGTMQQFNAYGMARYKLHRATGRALTTPCPKLAPPWRLSLAGRSLNYAPSEALPGVIGRAGATRCLPNSRSIV